MARGALKFFLSNIFLVALFLFWLLLSFFLPCVCVCQCFLCGAVFLCQCFLCVCVCVCVCWCWVGLKENKLFFLCWVGITIFPMVLSHPSGTLEKKSKKVKEKMEKKRKEKKENAPGGQMKRKNALGFLKEANDRRLRFFLFIWPWGQMKRKTHWVSRRKRAIGVCVFFFSFGLSCTSLSCLLSCLSPSLQQQHQGTRITSATVDMPARGT